MTCLLQAGIGSGEETVQDSTSDASEGGMRFGVYEIDCREDGSLCELGRGAMGVTYRATDTSNEGVKLAMLPSFHEALFSRREWAIAWLVALAPYIIYQVGRSLVWAVKTAKGRSAHNTFTKSDRVKIITASM